MIQKLSFLLFGLALIIISNGIANAEIYNGVEIESATSFADNVVDYIAGANVGAPYNDPAAALGAPDFTDNHNLPEYQVAPFPSVSLGDAGSLTLRFTNNSLTTSGDAEIDLWFFEVGDQIESTAVSISKDATTWISVDNIGGATSGIDIDAYLDSGVELWGKYYYVKLTDLDEKKSGSPYAGADIDAVAALSNAISDDANAPVAVIGSDQTVSQGDTVTLDGIASYDPDGGSFAYLWEQTHGASVSLSSSTTVQTVFTAPNVAADGESLVFRLTVTDSGGLQSYANTIVTVIGSSGNRPPVANAGPDQDGVIQAKKVYLNGSNSFDPESAAIQSYSWLQLSGTAVSLSSSSAANPTFTAPFVGTSGDTLVFELTVSDDKGLLAKDRCSVTVTDKNSPPVADAGDNQLVGSGDLVYLDGSGSSDPDTGKGDQIRYYWNQISGTRVDLSSYTTSGPSFTVPSVITSDEALLFELTVTDLAGLSAVDSCIINVATGTNRPPVADAGPASTTMVEGSTIDLDGSNSSDPDGDSITYRWVQKSGPPLTFSDTLIVQPSVTSSDVTADEIAVVVLTVTDASGLSGSDEIMISIEDTGTVVGSSETDGSDDGGCFIMSLINQ
ncbi:MAG: PKD domain-containing protein [Pseudomonadota bacterium]